MITLIDGSTRAVKNLMLSTETLFERVMSSIFPPKRSLGSVGADSIEYFNRMTRPGMPLSE